MKRIRILAVMIMFFSSIGSVNVYSQESLRETPIVRVVRQTAPGVVNISTERIVLLRQNPFWGRYGQEFDKFFNEHFSNFFVKPMKLKSVGSGVIVDVRGLIVTNAHVVNMASKIYIILNDGTTVEGEVLGVNQQEDVAIIKIIPPYVLKPVTFAKKGDIIIGETVVAIGDSMGLQNSVTAGIVSGTNRQFISKQYGRLHSGLIQTDAPINPGSSGGALLNLEGELIGINLAVIQEVENIGFAIPVAKIIDIMNEFYHFIGE
ncbi:MAG: trypsin-like peptidase domain-containing protein [Candidatus Omnitrophota bacterium]